MKKPRRTKTRLKSFTDLDGVFAGATGCGIKVGRDDLAYIYLPEAYSAAAVFTQNLTAAPCIQYSKGVLKKGKLRGIIVNAGCANAATGAQGFRNARATAQRAARLVGCRADEIAVASTGIIGKQLPMDKINSGLDELFGRPLAKEGSRVSRAIMTTDTFPKQIFLRRRIGSQFVSVSGIAKGAGMIAPNMATMLGFLVTDARISKGPFQKMLRGAVSDSFNMTSVDTDTSTNDMVMAFSTGKVPLSGKKHLLEFALLLTEACQELSKLIARDGEGATKLIEVTVTNAKNKEQARKMALNV
ncbi:MAG: bifunctional ornithine acetyltransferase/N-acetylglutamate synthase, partial [Deltaproteobacteria bacterium]|nr:bifunctional ornithine acetyltransferase/N-acetylglutamate synthase [Deltaproteobacteria bacterium]